MGSLKGQVSRVRVSLGGGAGASPVSLLPFLLPPTKAATASGKGGWNRWYLLPSPSPQSFTEPEQRCRDRALGSRFPIAPISSILTRESELPRPTGLPELQSRLYLMSGRIAVLEGFLMNLLTMTLDGRLRMGEIRCRFRPGLCIC